MHVRFHDTHAYPGCRATVIGERPGSIGAAEAEFSDGAVVAVSFARLGPDEILLEIAAYRTARGTAIPTKSWLLRRIAADSWKVASRPSGRN